MTSNTDLSPGMIALLATIRDGGQPAPRSWRSTDALRRRGLIQLNGFHGYSLTEAGTAALAERMVIDGQPR